MQNRLRLFLVMAGLTFALLLSCGGDDDEKKTSEACKTCVGGGRIVTFSDGVGKVSFEDGAGGQEYVLMPLAIGNMNTVNGADGSQNTFQVSATTSLRINEGSKKTNEEVQGSRDHMLRSIWNHWSPDRGMDQIKGFWELVENVDRMAVGMNAVPSSLKTSISQFGQASQGEVQNLLFRSLKERKKQKFKNNFLKNPSSNRESTSLGLTAAGDCPSTTVVMPAVVDGALSTREQSISAVQGSVVSQDAYCIVYLSTPATEPSQDLIQASIEKVLSTYKTVIYKNTFPANDQITFKPVVVVVDFDDQDLWPTTSALQVQGLFMNVATDVAKMPMLYMASDFELLAGASGTVSKSEFHATLAHEMQHAVMDYFRERSGKANEALYVDEGIAHFMEDVFGYGSLGFPLFAKAYLELFNTGLYPFLQAAQESGQGDTMARAGAQLMLYYLSSQEGGVTFSNGAVSGGGGLEFISRLVQGSGNKDGPDNIGANLAVPATNASLWMTRLLGFLGALVMDGTATENIDDLFKTQEPVKTVTNLEGATGKTFGMHFNGFGNLSDRLANIEKVQGQTELSLGFYQTKPMKITLSSQKDSVTFTSASDGAMVAVVRIK